MDSFVGDQYNFAACATSAPGCRQGWSWWWWWRWSLQVVMLMVGPDAAAAAGEERGGGHAMWYCQHRARVAQLISSGTVF
jgi:hypothetical protein